MVFWGGIAKRHRQMGKFRYRDGEFGNIDMLVRGHRVFEVFIMSKAKKRSP